MVSGARSARIEILADPSVSEEDRNHEPEEDIDIGVVRRYRECSARGHKGSEDDVMKGRRRDLSLVLVAALAVAIGYVVGCAVGEDNAVEAAREAFPEVVQGIYDEINAEYGSAVKAPGGR